MPKSDESGFSRASIGSNGSDPAAGYCEIDAANDAVDILPNAAAEARRQRVLAMLAENPEARYVLVTDTEADPEAVILTLGVRGRATCELRIPRDRYDPFLLLDLIQQHGGTVH